MKILVNVFHPHLDSSTINSVWVNELRKAEKATVNLLYSNYPDWNIDVAREQLLLLDHDRIIFQHPFYWYSTPPLMKKWLDEVLVYDWAYGPNGNALHGKDWISAISTGVRNEGYQAGGTHNYTMSEFLKPIQQTANLLGMNYLPPYVLHDAMQRSNIQVNQSAKKYLLHITNDGLDPHFNVENTHNDECAVCSTLKH